MIELWEEVENCVGRKELSFAKCTTRGRGEGNGWERHSGQGMVKGNRAPWSIAMPMVVVTMS